MADDETPNSRRRSKPKVAPTNQIPRTWRIVGETSELYGPLVAAAVVFAVLGRLLHWDFAETPLAVLTLPFSIVPLWLLVSPVLLLAVCGLAAVGVWMVLRCLRQRYAVAAADSENPASAPGCLTIVVAALIGLWVVASMISVGVFVRSHWFGPWPKLRHAVAEFNVPPGFVKIHTAEAGSEACFISCDEPRISVVLKTALPPDEACRAVDASVRVAAKNVGPSPAYIATPPDASCFIQGDLPNVYSDAHLFATLLRGRELRQYSWLLANVGTQTFADDDTVVALLFNSGID